MRPPTTPVAPGRDDGTVGGEGIHLIRADLDFILDQIRIAEANRRARAPLAAAEHARRSACEPSMGRSTTWSISATSIRPSSAPRTTVFPRLTTPDFNDAEDVRIDSDGLWPAQVGQATSYQQTSGYVFDSQPRTISNLIVDQTANNPAAVAAAGARPMAPGLSSARAWDGLFGTADDKPVNFIPNVSRRCGPVGPVQRVDDVLRPVLRSRPRSRHQGRQRHGLHPTQAG